MAEVVRIGSIDELIASVPHALGFVPERSMVCLALGGGPTARLDLPRPQDDLGEWVSALTEVYLQRHHPRRLALMAFGDEGTRCVDALAVLSDALLAAGPGGPEVGPVLWVDGHSWTDLGSGAQGLLDPGIKARIDAEFAVRGRVMPVGNREQLASQLRGNDAAVRDLLPKQLQQAEENALTRPSLDAEWLADRVHEFREGRTYLSDTDTARVLAVIQHRAPREAVVLGMSREHAAVDSELWCDVVRRAPSGPRDVAATILSLAFYLDGRGAHAWTALEEVSQPNALTELIEAALRNSVDPDAWGAALHTLNSTSRQRQALADHASRDRGRGRSHHRVEPVIGNDPGQPGPGR